MGTNSRIIRAWQEHEQGSEEAERVAAWAKAAFEEIDVASA